MEQTELRIDGALGSSNVVPSFEQYFILESLAPR
jgi:hypothetical protein